MTSRQNICTAVQYHIYGVEKSAQVCDKYVLLVSKMQMYKVYQMIQSIFLTNKVLQSITLIWLSIEKYQFVLQLPKYKSILNRKFNWRMNYWKVSYIDNTLRKKHIATLKRVNVILRLFCRIQQTTQATTKVKQMVTPWQMIIYR
jgi:hypothetical protein